MLGLPSKWRFPQISKWRKWTFHKKVNMKSSSTRLVEGYSSYCNSVQKWKCVLLTESFDWFFFFGMGWWFVCQTQGSLDYFPEKTFEELSTVAEMGFRVVNRTDDKKWKTKRKFRRCLCHLFSWAKGKAFSREVGFWPRCLKVWVNGTIRSHNNSFCDKGRKTTACFRKGEKLVFGRRYKLGKLLMRASLSCFQTQSLSQQSLKTISFPQKPTQTYQSRFPKATSNPALPTQNMLVALGKNVFFVTFFDVDSLPFFRDLFLFKSLCFYSTNFSVSNDLISRINLWTKCALSVERLKWCTRRTKQYFLAFWSSL